MNTNSDPLHELLGDAPPPLMVGPYEVGRDHAGRLVFTRPSHPPRWTPEVHHQNQMVPPTPPQLIEPGRPGEQIMLEWGHQADLLRTLRGPVSDEDAQRLVNEWLDALGDQASSLRAGPLHADTPGLIALCQAATHALRRHGLQFVRYGFHASDLFGIRWTIAGPQGVGVLLSTRESAIRSLDTDVLHARPADPEPPQPPWCAQRPRWRRQAHIGDWRVSIRPLTGEAVLRRPWPSGADANLSDAAEETVVIDADTAKRLAQMIEEKLNVR